MEYDLSEGDEVKWANPLSEGEERERFSLIELNGDRCMIRYICDLPIPPIQVAMVADLIPANAERNSLLK